MKKLHSKLLILIKTFKTSFRVIWVHCGCETDIYTVWLLFPMPPPLAVLISYFLFKLIIHLILAVTHKLLYFAHLAFPLLALNVFQVPERQPFPSSKPVHVSVYYSRCRCDSDTRTGGGVWHSWGAGDCYWWASASTHIKNALFQYLSLENQFCIFIYRTSPGWAER